MPNSLVRCIRHYSSCQGEPIGGTPRGLLMRFVLYSSFILALAASAAPSAQAAHVTRVWHVDHSDPDSTLCRESGGTRTIITTGLSSAARYDDPTPAEWQQSGCAASKPHPISHAEAVQRFNDQTAEMTRPLDFSRDIMPLLRKLQAHNAAAQTAPAQ